MMYNFPFFPHFYPRPYYRYPQSYVQPVDNRRNKTSNKKTEPKEKKKEKEEKVEEQDVLFDIFGVQLHSDDILLLCLIFFLYQEGVKDEFLFMALVLLLLS